jgi:hypothetical protein
VWFEKNKNSFNLKFKSYNTSWMGQTRKDFIQASEIYSELLFMHCNCCSKTRGVTVSSLRSYVPLAYSDNERAKQLLYALDDHVSGMKEYADFAILNTEELFSKLTSYELSRKDCPNHNASLTSKTLITSA